MLVDEDKFFKLTKYAVKKNEKIIESDHNTLFCSFSLSFEEKPKNDRNEIFNFRNKENLKKNGK